MSGQCKICEKKMSPAYLIYIFTLSIMKVALSIGLYKPSFSCSNCYFKKCFYITWTR